MTTMLTHPKCGKQFPHGSRTGHCSGSGRVAFPLWSATLAGADLNTPPLEQSPDSGGVSAQSFSDHLSSLPLEGGQA